MRLLAQTVRLRQSHITFWPSRHRSSSLGAYKVTGEAKKRLKPRLARPQSSAFCVDVTHAIAGFLKAQ